MIKGLSEKTKITRLGKVRLGIKKHSQNTSNTYPQSVDYFVVNADKSTSEEAAKNFHKVYGDKPTVIDIMLPSDEIEKVFPQWYKRYGKSGLICKGDGEKAQATDPKTGALIEGPCKGEECPFQKKGVCGPSGSLLFFLPKVEGFGVWQLDTGSVNSIIQINSGLKTIIGLTGGRLAGIPLKLYIKPLNVSFKNEKGEKQSKTVYTVDLTWDFTLEAVLSRKTSGMLTCGFTVADPEAEEKFDNAINVDSDNDAGTESGDNNILDDDPFPDGDF